MKAIRYVTYGGPEVLHLQDAALPAVSGHDVLVRVEAVGLNPLDWHFMRGLPYLVRLSSGPLRPKNPGLGVDFAGVVESVGPDVTSIKAGDEVFGAASGALAEYVSIRDDSVLAAKPGTLTFEQAAAVPVAAFTALQALRDKAGVGSGHRVLINGAAGGVGTFAVQIAKVLGAEVTGVCSAGNTDLVASLGAGRVIDYAREDYTTGGERYDAIIDMAGSRTLTENRRVLAPRGVLVAVGGPDAGRWIGPLRGPLKMVMVSPFIGQRLIPILAHNSRDDLLVLAEWLAGGKVRPVIDRAYSLADTPAAIAYLEQGHARGKVVVRV